MSLESVDLDRQLGETDFLQQVLQHSSQLVQQSLGLPQAEEHRFYAGDPQIKSSLSSINGQICTMLKQLTQFANGRQRD